VTTTRRVLPMLLMSAFLIAAAAISLGWPQPAMAANFFVGGVPTLRGGEAVVELLAWLAITATTSVAVVDTLVSPARRVAVPTPSGRAALVLIAGLLVLGIAIVHRAVPSYTLCCGGDQSHVREVIELAR
jgi:hypothetical protein